MRVKHRQPYLHKNATGLKYSFTITALPSRSFVSFVVKAFDFPMSAMSRDDGDPGDSMRSLYRLGVEQAFSFMPASKHQSSGLQALRYFLSCIHVANKDPLTIHTTQESAQVSRESNHQHPDELD